jgi:hypothetical protein
MFKVISIWWKYLRLVSKYGKIQKTKGSSVTVYGIGGNKFAIASIQIDEDFSGYRNCTIKKISRKQETLNFRMVPIKYTAFEYSGRKPDENKHYVALFKVVGNDLWAVVAIFANIGEVDAQIFETDNPVKAGVEFDKVIKILTSNYNG